MDRNKEYDNEICPVCGYYCLGRGGMGCIDKPVLTGLRPAKPQDNTKSLEKKDEV